MSHACMCSSPNEEELYPLVDQVIEKYRGNPKELITVLHRIQKLFDYLPRQALEKVSDGLGMSLNEIHGVASFYSFFSMVPKGRHSIKVCLGTACYVKGGQKIVEHLEKKLAVHVGGTTQDRRFSLDEVRCIGACGLAPAVLVNDDVYAKVEPDKVEEILSKYE
ncbi:NADH-quinone oxidoreductase subunit NuoE [Desulfallas thermosapovorans]|uniref:NADP-reducing hydrogenase subunit HndA n=1 Tax=Desulfallas thermosapovorans DSM 6562 TaxID=1121431 RepID=A0A5S4ZP14_9FIRM|nr:NADH-quinone oxidoreductase subunit NuoE [Desulfallas thermosapovorans]TYO94588.1 NADP-reducing hydrogenase subunit HndA [Desulfallas thermosapovorans DSM 6562]